MDISIQEEKTRKNALSRFKERAGFWNPSTLAKQKMYLDWVKKQVKQRQKTIDLKGVTHSLQMLDILLKEKQAFVEEAKRITDLIKDGR